VQLVVAARTDVGRIRSGNEDSLYADATPSRGLFIVADGMGGHAAGEVASAMAVQIIAREFDGTAPDSAEAPDRMARALKEANRAIYERTARETDKQGMGTTASVLTMADGGYLIGQVGDSRVYRLRDGELEQLTRDHSYVQEQVDAGLLTPEQAKYHPYSNVITRCVGANAHVSRPVRRRRAPGRRVPAGERRAHRHGRRPRPQAAPGEQGHPARVVTRSSRRPTAGRAGQHHRRARAGDGRGAGAAGGQAGG
jgi:protein phosphatase